MAWRLSNGMQRNENLYLFNHQRAINAILAIPVTIVYILYPTWASMTAHLICLFMFTLSAEPAPYVFIIHIKYGHIYQVIFPRIRIAFT